MRIFHYFDGNEIRVGDHVIGPRGRLGRVDKIIQPESAESNTYDAPLGGVLFIFDWDGVPGPVMMTPPDGKYWEDIEFVARENGKK